MDLLSKRNKRLYLFLLFACMLLMSFIGKHQYTGDIYFIYNRALQMKTCLEDGNIPYFYYKDFNNMGYGSSFFYGHLFLYLFLPSLKYGFSCFAMSYHTFSMIIYMVGVVLLFRELTDDWEFGSFTFMSCSLIIFTVCYSWLYGLVLGQGLSLIFFAFCIRFFRDSKKFYLASLFFFFLLNTHMLTALVAFVVCVCLMLNYFDRKRIIDYVKFALSTILMCSYNICNYIYHSDILNRISEIRFTDGNTLNVCYNMFFGFLGEIIHSFIKYEKLMPILSVPFLIILVLSMKGLNKKWKILTISGVVICLLSHYKIFYNTFLSAIFQFPIRYLYVVCIVFSIVIARNRNKFKYLLYLFGFLELYLAFMLYIFNIVSVYDTDVYVDTYLQEFNRQQVINGEFLDKSFVSLGDLDSIRYDATHAFNKDTGEEFSFYEDKEKLYVDVDVKGTSELQFPKIYYRGYHLYDENGNDIDLWKGYSQFITAKVTDYKGRLLLVYEHPSWLKSIGVISYSFAFCVIVYYIMKGLLYESNRHSKQIRGRG